MSKSIEVRKYVGSGFPPDEGEKLANILLKEDTWDGLTLDVRGCQNGVLISSFVNAFLQRIADRQQDRLPAARKLEWTTAFEFQSENIRTWVERFEPAPAVLEA